MSILLWIISGILAGWLTGLIMKGRGFGIIGDLIIGIVGGVIGGYVSNLVGIHFAGWVGDIITAVIGGVIFVAIIRLLRRI